MKFRGLKPIVSETNAWREISESLRDLFQGLTKLSFVDNMEAFEVKDVSIAAGTTQTFANQIKFIPTRWFVLRNSAGMPISDENFAGWSIAQVSLKNVGASATTLTVVFMR